MGGKSKAPSYQSASYNTGGLFGSSTTDKSGTTFDPTKWETKTMGTVGKYMNPTLKSLVDNNFMNDPNFLRYQEKFTDDMNRLYDSSVLSNLAGRGLMRSSGLQSATNSFADTLAQNQLNLYDNYRGQLQQNLAALQGTGNTIYNYLTGINQGSQQQAGSLNQYNLNRAQVNNQGSDLFGTIANGIGSAASLAGGIASGNPKLITNGIGGLGSTSASATGSMPSAASSNNSALMSALLSATR